MTLCINWYLYHAFSTNIKGAGVILAKKIQFVRFAQIVIYYLPGFAQIQQFTTYPVMSIEGLDFSTFFIWTPEFKGFHSSCYYVK